MLRNAPFRDKYFTKRGEAFLHDSQRDNTLYVFFLSGSRSALNLLVIVVLYFWCAQSVETMSTVTEREAQLSRCRIYRLSEIFASGGCDKKTHCA